ncbi:hypothetical protein LJR231_004293 [Phyllobacterium sp. LjRoot231]|uniref:hypothetical protein n=1 Tax=Phyllobacterium sp. LjRoot231 TaxID=3342289 RepID=UPI003ED12239
MQHPLRVMLALHDNNERIVGVLHDIVEKTGWSLDNLRSEGFPDPIIAAIDSMSRRHGEEYSSSSSARAKMIWDGALRSLICGTKSKKSNPGVEIPKYRKS